MEVASLPRTLRSATAVGPLASGSRAFAASGGASDAAKQRALAASRQAQLEVQRQVQREQLLRFRPVAPFQEVRHSTSGSATVMALLYRPTSPSIFRLALGLMFSSAFVAALHWFLVPTDPFWVLSGSCGAFAFVAVVGSSHTPLWYAGLIPALAL